jgi:hypothetical protein
MLLCPRSPCMIPRHLHTHIQRGHVQCAHASERATSTHTDAAAGLIRHHQRIGQGDLQNGAAFGDCSLDNKTSTRPGRLRRCTQLKDILCKLR